MLQYRTIHKRECIDWGKYTTFKRTITSFFLLHCYVIHYTKYVKQFKFLHWNTWYHSALSLVQNKMIYRYVCMTALYYTPCCSSCSRHILTGVTFHFEKENCQYFYSCGANWLDDQPILGYCIYHVIIRYRQVANISENACKLWRHGSVHCSTLDIVSHRW